MSRVTPLLAIGLLGGWSPLIAQSVPPATQSAFSERLIVTATLEPEPVDRLAATVDVVDADEIAARQATSALELLRTLPGVAAAQSGSPGKVASLFVRGAGSAATLVLLDGVPLNDPVLGAFDWSAVESAGLDRIEVVRGPYSALWGSGAMGGVVQLLTRRAARPFAELRAEGGSRGARRGELSGAYAPGSVALDLAAALWRQRGELDNDSFDGDVWRLRVDWRRGGGRLGALVRDGDATIGVPFDYAGLPSPGREQRSGSRLLALPFDWTDGRWQLEGNFARHETDLDLEDPADPFAASVTETRRDTARAVASRRFEPPFWIGAGLEHERESATTGGAFGPGLEDAHQSTDALFAQAAWSGSRFRIELGVRRDDTSAFGAATSTRGGVVFALGGGVRLRASWGESFRAPSLGDLYYPFFGNPELRPERGESGELGLDLAGRRWSAGAVAFENDFEDLIQFDLVRGLPFNIGRARTRGLEATLARRGRTLDLRANATWLDAVDLDRDAPLPRRPRAQASLVTLWRDERWTAAATARWVGAREDVGRVELDPYSALDLALSWREDESALLRPYLRIENALDRDYEEVAGFPAAGRRWVLGVRFGGGA